MTDDSTSGDGVRLLLGRGSVYTLARFAQLGGMMVVLPLLTRALGPEEFGRASIALVVTQIAHLVGSAGLPSAVTRRFFEPGGDETAKRLIASTVGTASVTAAVGVLLVPFWSPALGLSSTGSATISMIAIVPLAALSGGQALLRAKDKARAFVGSALISSVGAQIAGLSTAYVGDRSAVDYLIGLTIGYSLAAVVSSRSSGIRWASPGSVELAAALRFGVPTIAHSLAMYVMNAGDRIVIEHVEGAEQVARYQVMYVVAGLGTLLLNSVNNAWSPLVYGAPNETRWSRLREASGIVHIVTALGASSLALVSPAIVHLLVPTDFVSDDLAMVCALVAGAAMPYATFIAYALVLFHERRTTAMAAATFAVATANVAMNIALVPHLGLEGAAIATLCSYTTLGLLVRAIASRAVALPPPSREEFWSIIGAVVGVSAAAVFPVVGEWLVARTLLGVALAVVLTLFAWRRFRAA